MGKMKVVRKSCFLEGDECEILCLEVKEDRMGVTELVSVCEMVEK